MSKNAFKWTKIKNVKGSFYYFFECGEYHNTKAGRDVYHITDYYSSDFGQVPDVVDGKVQFPKEHYKDIEHFKTDFVNKVYALHLKGKKNPSKKAFARPMLMSLLSMAQAVYDRDADYFDDIANCLRQRKEILESKDRDVYYGIYEFVFSYYEQHHADTDEDAYHVLMEEGRFIVPVNSKEITDYLYEEKNIQIDPSQVRRCMDNMGIPKLEIGRPIGS